jgi:O-antigen/teichoic acid export membrane protein
MECYQSGAIRKKNSDHSSEALSTKVVRSGLWVFSLRIINRVLGLIRTIVLARLLVPEDFGLLGIAMLSIATLETFSQTGVDQALIQKRENVALHLDTAWTVSAIRGIVLFLVLFFSAPIVAKFFNSTEATLVIRVIAINTLLSGFKNIGVLFFQKELEFNKQFVYEFSATLVDLIIAVSLALILRNVWALVWGGLAANFVRVFLSYVLHPYRPRVTFQKEKFQTLFGFGKWVFSSSILIFLITRGDDIFVGKMLGVTALGFYQMAYMLSNLPATEITHVISQVTFPAYSKLQEDLPKLKDAYLKVIQLTAFLAFPLAGLIFVLASDFTQIFLGDKWISMVSTIEALALAGAARSIAATNAPIFYSIGKPQIDTKWQIIRLVVLIIFIYPFTMKWGIRGTGLAVLLSYLTSTLKSAEVIKILNCKFINFAKTLLFAFFNTVVITIMMTILKCYFNINKLSNFFIIVTLGITSYIFITYFSDKIFNYGINNNLKNFVSILTNNLQNRTILDRT